MNLSAEELQLDDEDTIVECKMTLRIGFADERSARSAYEQYLEHNQEVQPVQEDENGWCLGLSYELSDVAAIESRLEDINRVAEQFNGEPVEREDLQELLQNPCIQNLSLLTALSAYENGQYQQAIRHLSQLIENGTADPVEYLGVVGLAQLKSDDFAAARQTFESHLKLDLNQVDRSSSVCNLATCMFRLEEFEQAERQYESALNSPKHGYACYGLACLRCRENRVDETVDWLKQAVRAERHLKDHARGDEDFASIADDDRFLSITKVSFWDRVMSACGR